VFSMFLSSRAVPATPGERLGASAEPFPETCGLHVDLRRSASPLKLTRLHLGSLRATARDFAASGLPTDRHSGPASAGHLTTSRRGPRYPIAQRFIGVGSSHPTRNTPLSRRTKSHLRGAVGGSGGSLSAGNATVAFPCALGLRACALAQVRSGASHTADFGPFDATCRTDADRLGSRVFKGMCPGPQDSLSPAASRQPPAGL
jgi:hypothetical protein